ncbi:hypothetical protein ACFQMM_22430 [Saliphagus sp. GCM10025308]
MDEKHRTYLRRTLLAATGAVGIGAIVPTTTADHDTECEKGTSKTDTITTKDQIPAKSVYEKDGRVLTLKCGEHSKEFITCRECHAPWAPGAITIHNCSPCKRHVEIAVSGKLAATPCAPQGETDAFDSHLSTYVSGGDRQTYFFSGSIRQLDAEDGDVNIGISQRSEQYAHPC